MPTLYFLDSERAWYKMTETTSVLRSLFFQTPLSLIFCHQRIKGIFLCTCELFLFICFGLGSPCWRSHPELPTGEVSGRPSESRGEELPYFLPAFRRRRRRALAKAGPWEEPPTIPLLSEGMNRVHFCQFFDLILSRGSICLLIGEVNSDEYCWRSIL